MGDDIKPEEVEGDDIMDDTNETEEATESAHVELNQEMPEMEPQVHKESKVMDERIEAGNMKCAEAETENLVEVAACDLVS